MGKSKGQIKSFISKKGKLVPLEERRTGFSAQQAAQADYQENFNQKFFNQMGELKSVGEKGSSNSNKTPRLGVNKKVVVPKLAPKKAEAIKTNLPSERVKSNTPQKSMGQIGREMAKSGPRKNLRETVASVKGKLQNAYRKATGSKSVSGKMDGKTFTGYERGNSRKSVVKVSNPTLGSSKMVEKFDRNGKLKSQKIVDRNASGKKIQVIKRKG